MEYMEGDDGDDSTMGQEDAANMLGQVARALVRRPVKGAGGRKIYTRPPLPTRTAQPTEAELRSFMGFGSVTWAVADGANKITIVEPQEAFRGERLIVEVAIPATITNAPIVTVVRIDIGTQPQSPSTEFAAPAAMFRPDATYSGLDLQVCPAGTKIQITLGISAAPAGAGIVTAVIGLYGQWIR
jgi:hypothetical protein